MMFVFIRPTTPALACALLAAGCQSSNAPERLPVNVGGQAGQPHDTSSGSTSGAGGVAGAASGGSAGSSAGGEPSSAGANGDAGASGAPATEPPLNGCAEFVDRTEESAVRTLHWADEIAYAAERCMKIRTGQSVSFSGDFGEHPIAPRGGDTPNPITVPTPSFPSPGKFGYYCTTHPVMNGVIWVLD